MAERTHAAVDRLDFAHARRQSFRLAACRNAHLRFAQAPRERMTSGTSWMSLRHAYGPSALSDTAKILTAEALASRRWARAARTSSVSPRVGARRIGCFHYRSFCIASRLVAA